MAANEASRRLMTMALAVKHGQTLMKDIPDGVKPSVRGVLRSLSERQLRDLAERTMDRPKKIYVGVPNR
jgi:hypothetical protein